MREIKAIIREELLDEVIYALHELPDLPGVIVSRIQGIGRRRSDDPSARPVVEYGQTTMVKLEIVVPAALVRDVVETIRRFGSTGRPGDGKIFVMRVEEAVRIRNGDEGTAALS